MDRSATISVAGASSKPLDSPPSLKEAVFARIEAAGPWGIPAPAEAILRHFLAIADEHGRHEQSVPEIAVAVGLDVRRLQRWFGTLRRMRWIRQTYRKIGPKLNDTTVYQLLVDGLYWHAEAAYHVPRGAPLRPPPRRPSATSSRGGVVTPTSPHFSRSSSGLRPRPTSASPFLETGPAPAFAAAANAMTELASATKESGRKAGIEVGLDAIGPKSTFVPPLFRLRVALVNAGLGDLAGDGYEQRLQRIAVARQLDANDVKTMLRQIGDRRQTGIFNAAGKPSPWAGEPSRVRGFVYRCFERERSPKPSEEVTKEPVVLRDGPALHRPRVDDARTHAHLTIVKAESLSSCGRRVLAALLADYHGEKPMTSIATPDVAHRLAQTSEDACAGGRLTTEDVIAVVRHYATIRAFRMKRGELVLAGALEAFVRKELNAARRGCAAALNEKIRTATFVPYRPKIDTRQPGGLEHLRRDRPVPAPSPLPSAAVPAIVPVLFATPAPRPRLQVPQDDFVFAPSRFAPKELRDLPVDEALRRMLENPRAYHTQELAKVREDHRRQRQHHLWEKNARAAEREAKAGDEAQSTRT